jgi:hypothetical protein
MECLSQFGRTEYVRNALKVVSHRGDAYFGSRTGQAACVQRDFREQVPQSPDEALYMV